MGNVFGQNPIGDTFVESHPFAECAKGWGTRRYVMVQAESRFLQAAPVRNDKIL